MSTERKMIAKWTESILVVVLLLVGVMFPDPSEAFVGNPTSRGRQQPPQRGCNGNQAREISASPITSRTCGSLFSKRITEENDTQKQRRKVVVPLGKRLVVGSGFWSAGLRHASAVSSSTRGRGTVSAAARKKQLKALVLNWKSTWLALSRRDKLKTVLLSALVVLVLSSVRTWIVERSLAQDDLSWLWANYEKSPIARRRAFVVLFFQLWTSWIRQNTSFLSRTNKKTASWQEATAETFSSGVLRLGPFYMKLAQVASTQRLLPKEWVTSLIQSNDRKREQDLGKGLEIWDSGLRLAQSIDGLDQYRRKYSKDLRVVNMMVHILDRLTPNRQKERKQWKTLVDTAETKMFAKRVPGVKNYNIVTDDDDEVVADDFEYENVLERVTTVEDDKEEQEAISTVPDDKEWLAIVSELQKQDEDD